MGIALITALTIVNNYPGNIYIDAGQNKDNEKWYGSMYLLRDGDIHRSLLSHSHKSEGYDTKEEAENSLKEVCEKIIKAEKNGEFKT